MTNLDDRYRLLKCVALGGGIRTHNAQEASSGRPVRVHILDGAEPDTVERLRGQVGALPVADRSRILEMTPTAGGFAIVSEFLAGLTTFPEWLDARAPAASAAPVPVAPLEPAPPPKVGTTESFVIGKVASSNRPARTPPPTPPGEFTQLFQGAGGAAAGGPPPMTAPPPPAVPITPRVPAAVPMTPNAAPPVAPTAVHRQVPPPVAAAPPRPAPGLAPPPPAAPPLRPGEFTGLFTPSAAPTPGDVASSPLVGP